MPYLNVPLLPEDEPWGSKHVEDIMKIKILFDKGEFCFFMLHDCTAMHGAKKKSQACKDMEHFVGICH
jgi:hypothetical protein